MKALNLAGRTRLRPDTPTTSPGPSFAGRTRPLRALWNTIVGVIAMLVGLAPHVLHHIGLVAGTALIAGAGGTALFAVIGLAASVPLLVRLRRRFHSWWAPAIGLGLFAVMFSISAFVIGPAINGDDGGGRSPATPAPSTSVDHNSHH
ncbi:MAG TPA: hypothetical protein VFU43_01255 [Streptosporangiaceae bacterium]|nr:hypothetical protein [Streptosporangiaceae bacterium]